MSRTDILRIDIQDTYAMHFDCSVTLKSNVKEYVDSKESEMLSEAKDYVDGVKKFIIEQPIYGMDKIQLPENVGIKSVTIQCKDTIEGANNAYVQLFDSNGNQIDQIEYFMSNGAILEVPIEGYENTPVAQIGLYFDLPESAITEVIYYSGKILDKAKEYTDTKLGNITKKEENIVTYSWGDDRVQNLHLPKNHQYIKTITVSDLYDYRNTSAELTVYYTDGTSEGYSIAFEATGDVIDTISIENTKPIERIEIINNESTYFITEYVYYTEVEATVEEYVDFSINETKSYIESSIQQAIIDSWEAEV